MHIQITNNRYGVKTTTVIRSDLIASISVITVTAQQDRTTVMEPTPETKAQVELTTVGGLSISCDVELLADAERRASALREKLGWTDVYVAQ